MSIHFQKSHLLQRIILRSLRMPLVYLVIGIVLVALSYIDDVFTIITWKRAFNITEKLGDIFIALALITFVYNMFVYLCLRYEQKMHDVHKILAVILASIRRGMRAIFILIMLNVAINIAAPTQLTYLVLANNIVNVVIICSIGWLAIQIFYTVENVVYQYMLDLTAEEHIRIKALYTKIRIIRNIASFVIFVITMAAVLMSFNSVRNIGISLLASAGFLTAIAGLAAQRSLFSLFSGLQIAMSQVIRIGDIVLIEKETGIVEEITFTYITLKLGDRRRLIVPINYFVEKPFENWSRYAESVRSSFHFHVDFLMPIEPLREELNRILQASTTWDGQAQKLQVANMNDRSVEIRIQVSAANADDLSDLRSEVREKMLDFIRKHYPQFFPNVRYHSPKNNGDIT